MRLAWASVGAARAAMVTAITEAVVRKDVFTEGPEKREAINTVRGWPQHTVALLLTTWG
ncbi:hypothetical protein D3C72_2076250 [compost metagenome]